VAAALADEETASEHEQVETGDVLRHSIEEGESLLLPLLVEQLRSSLLLEKNSTGCVAPLFPPPHSHSSQSLPEEGHVERVEDSGTESGEDLRLLAVGLRDSIELHRQQSCDASTQKINSTSGSTEPFGPSLLLEVQTALSRLQASLQLGSIGGQGEVLDPARRDALLHLVSRLQASLQLPAPPDKANSKNDSLEIPFHPPKQKHRFENKKIVRQNRHTVAVTREELDDARRVVEENAAKDRLTSNSGCFGAVGTAHRLVQQSSAGDLALPEGSMTASSVVSPVMSAFRPVHFAPRLSLPGLISNGNTSAKPFFLPQLQNSGVLRNSQSHIENQRSSFSDMDYKSGDTAIRDLNGIHRTSEESESLNSPCIMNNSALADNNLPHCNVQKETGIHQVNQLQNQPQSDKPVSMHPITVVHREYRPGRLGNEGIRPIQKSVSLDSPNVAVQNVISLAEQAIQKVAIHSSSTSSIGSSKASTPLRSDSGNSVPEKVVHKPLSKAASLDSSSSSKASTPQSSDGGTSAAERVLHKSVSQAPVPQRSDSAEGLQRRSVSQGSALSSTSSSKASTPRSDSGSSLPNRHIQKPVSSESSSPHIAAAQSVSLDNIDTSVTIPQRSTPEHKAISHSVSLDSDSRDYDPSVLLFTPAQSVQIAVHKAAINKQLSLEEEKRQRMNAQFCQKTYDNDSADDDDDDDGSDLDSSSEDEGSSETDVEEGENTSTVRQSAVTEKEKIEVSSNHHSKNEDDRHSQIDVNCAQIRMLNIYNSEQNSAEPEIWHANIDDGDKHVAVKVSETNKNVWSNSEQWNANPVNQNPAWLDVQNMNQTVQKPIQNICAQQNNTETETNSGNTGVDMSSAQRLLQMATEDTKTVVSRSHGRTDRKVKMKRANTIDIPKPLNFYEIEEETDYSSGEEYEGERDSKSVTDSSSGHNHNTYLALRGPIRVGGGKRAFGDKVTPPTFQPKTENDHKFLTFLQHHSNGKGSMWRGEGGFSKTTTYNPAARGGQHWSSRFTNIKTAFESPAGRDGDYPGSGRNVTSSGPASARMFWQSADDSVTVMKSAAAASGPKLTRQGSIFLKKLFEQKEQEQQSKLPWTEKNSVSDDSVVVGSLTVAASTGSVLSKKQLFTPPQSPATVHSPLNVNKFSHAPMSAFQPIEKKEKGDTVNQPVGDSVKQAATQKFTAAPKPSKQRTGLSQHTKQELPSPVSTSLPWTRESTQLNHGVLNSAVVKFEGITRETSPQPAPFSRPRSQSQEKIAVPKNFSVFVKQPTPVPVPKSYVSPSHIPGSVQGRYQEQTSEVLSLNSLKQPAPIPTPPMLTAPHLIQNYGNNQQICHKEPEICKSFNQQKYEGGVRLGEQNGQEKTSEEIRQYCTKSYTTEIDYGTEEFTKFPSVSPVQQTYSGSVTSRSSSVYPQSGSVFIPNSNVQQPELDSLHSPDNSLPSPEAFTAVSRIMTGPTSHQAVTVTHRTRHRYDDMDEEASGRSSAAKNLASVLIKFSSASENNRNLQSVPKQQSSKSPTSPLRNKEEDAIQSFKQNTSVYSSKKSPTVDMKRQDPRESQPHHHQPHLLSKQSQKETKPLTSSMNRHHSEPDIASMISDDQFVHYQQELKMKAAGDTNYFRSPVYQNCGISKAIGYPHCSDGPARGLGKFTHAGSVPGLAEESDHFPSVSARVRPASTESLITTTSTEELQESGESVLTTRLQIPVYSNSNKLHNLAQSCHNAPRSSSLHDVSDTHTPSKNTFTSPNPSSSVSPSLTLRKSGSWHQLVAGQQGIRNKRPQSLALPDLTVPSSNVHRIPPALPKTKSSHSLSFPKQFEAALSPDSVENKQRKVEAYLKTSSKPKTQEVKMKVQELQDNFVPPASDTLILDENLENVDEAFENVFNATISSNIEAKSKQNTAHKTKRQLRQPATEELSPSHLSGSASSQFVRKQQAWEESSSVRTKLAQHLSSK